VTPKTPSARSCSVINTVDGSCNHRRQSFEPIRTPCFNAVRQESAGTSRRIGGSSGGKRATTMKRRRVAKSDDGSRWGERNVCWWRRWPAWSVTMVVMVVVAVAMVVVKFIPDASHLITLLRCINCESAASNAAAH